MAQNKNFWETAQSQPRNLILNRKGGGAEGQFMKNVPVKFEKSGGKRSLGGKSYNLQIYKDQKGNQYEYDPLTKRWQAIGASPLTTMALEVTEAGSPEDAQPEQPTVPPKDGGTGGRGEKTTPEPPTASTKKVPLQLAMWQNEDMVKPAPRKPTNWKDSMHGGFGGTGTGIADALMYNANNEAQKAKRADFLNRVLSDKGGAPMDLQSYTYQHQTTPEEQTAANRQLLVDMLTSAKTQQALGASAEDAQNAKLIEERIKAGQLWNPAGNNTMMNTQDLNKLLQMTVPQIPAK